MSKNKLLVFAVVLGVCVQSCSSTQKKQSFAEIPDFQTLAFVETDEIPTVEYLKGGGEKSIEGMQKGTTTGMASGMAAGAILCGVTGPFAAICITGLGGAGFLAGGAGGLLVGIGDISDANAERIRETLSHIDQENDFQQMMRVELDKRVPAHLVVQPDEADIKVSPVLYLIDVEDDSTREIHVELKGMLLFTWIDSHGDEYVGKADFKEKSDSGDIDEWLRGDGSRFEQEISAMITGLADQMTERITLRVGN